MTSATHAPSPDGTRRRARRGEGDRLREEILNATADLLVELGSADKVSTRGVAKRVGCSSPSLYLHFPDRAALLYAVCERQFEKLGEVLSLALDGVDDPIERLCTAAHAYAHFAIDHPEQYRVMMMDEGYDKVHEDDFAQLATSVGFGLIVRTVQDGIDAGLLAPADPSLVALSLWASVHGVVSLIIVKPSLIMPPLDDLVDHVCQQNLQGMRPR